MIQTERTPFFSHAAGIYQNHSRTVEPKLSEYPQYNDTLAQVTPNTCNYQLTYSDLYSLAL